MPEIGEIRKGREIGKEKNRWFQLVACPDCGKTRWVRLYKGELAYSKCHKCCLKGMGNSCWNGGRVKRSDGYISIWLSSTDFFYPMVNKKGYVLEHRLVVAKALGRCLHRWEIVHHKGVKYPKGSIENKQDNRYPENLQLVSDDRHKQITILENQIAQLGKRILILEAEIILLKFGDRECVQGN